MINVGENNISVYAGDSEVSVYIGDELIYPLNFGELTGISIDNLTWVTDISWEGGTGTSANCSYVITGYYDSGKTRKLNSKSTVEGSITADSTTSETRDLVGTLVLTATCSGFTATGSVDAYQEIYTPYPANNEIWYTTSDGQTITPSGLSPTSNTYTSGKGVMKFANDVTSIPNRCFRQQSTLLTVVCPSSVTSLGSSVIQNSTLTAFTCEYATSFNYDHCMWYATELVSYKNNVATATGGVGMFEGCSSLTSVEMTACSKFDYYCFYNCSSLTSIKLGATPPNWAVSGVGSLPNNGTLYVPTEAVSTYESWKSGKTGISNWTVVGY